MKFLKLKSWYLGRDALSEEERQQLDNPSAHLRVGRWLRRWIYRPFKYARRRLRNEKK